MPETPSEPKDMAEMLEGLARRMRETREATGEPVDARAPIVVTPAMASLMDEGPILGALDIFTDRDAITVTAETRNAEAREVHVSILDGRLLINIGEGARAFTRDLALPEPVDENAAVATFRNGVLDVVLPRRAP